MTAYANSNCPRSARARKRMEESVAAHYAGILDSLGIAWKRDPNTQDTPGRVAKMLCREVFRGRYDPPPVITTFPNTARLDEIVATGPITLRSTCSHHLCPIMGKVWVGIIYGDRLAGLSKLNRIVDWFASRPQIQEELTMQVADYIEDKLRPKGVAVVIKAHHTCMTWRGVRENPEALMSTSVMRGVFRNKPEARQEFLALIA